MKARKFTGFRSVFTRGLAALLPTLLTIWILKKAYDFLFSVGARINEFVLAPSLKLISSELGETVKDSRAMTFVGFLLGVLGIYLVGSVLVSLVGRRIWAAMEHYLSTLPLVRLVYPMFKQLTDFFFTERKVDFRSVCAVQYPRKNCWSLGFVTGPGLKSITRVSGRRMLAVFIPSSPTPMTGYLIYFPADEVTLLPISVDQMLKLTMSGGVVPPLSEVEDGLQGNIPTPDLPPPEVD